MDLISDPGSAPTFILFGKVLSHEFIMHVVGRCLCGEYKLQPTGMRDSK